MRAPPGLTTVALLETTRDEFGASLRPANSAWTSEGRLRLRPTPFARHVLTSRLSPVIVASRMVPRRRSARLPGSLPPREDVR
jgi:hypothetical protein